MSLIVHYRSLPYSGNSYYETEIIDGNPSNDEIKQILLQRKPNIIPQTLVYISHPNNKDEEKSCNGCCRIRIMNGLYDSIGHGPSRNNPYICVECKYVSNNREKL